MNRSFLAQALLLGMVATALPPLRAAGLDPRQQPRTASTVTPAAAPVQVTVPVSPAVAIDPAQPLVPPPLPSAIESKGERPKADPSVLPPAATSLDPSLLPLAAPPTLGLPDRIDQVQVLELRPIGLAEAETLAEVNNPRLKAVASQVEQQKAQLRGAISSWYPSINLDANSFPRHTDSYRFLSGPQGSLPGSETYGQTLQAEMGITIRWDLINPQRVPQIAAARDEYEKSRNQYLVELRELRLRVSRAYFQLQLADESVRIGQESVRSSLVSLKDARARFQAGVATKLEVLEAETQLARDQQLLTGARYSITPVGTPGQALARRNLASLLNLPQNVNPTAKDPSRVLGTWIPSLQESILAAFAIREELDQKLLDVSIANSRANFALGEVQPSLGVFNRFGWDRTKGATQNISRSDALDNDAYQYGASNAFGLSLSWRVFDGGAAAADARRFRQQAQQQRYEFASTRDEIRLQVEDGYFNLIKNDRNIATTTREVLSAREALRLARLRFQAGVTTQREVVDNQRDLTQAEVRYAQAVSDYNTSLAELRRATGLDRIALCVPSTLPATKPAETGEQIPIELPPRQTPCQSQPAPSGGRG